jgi:hypothetical protein
MCQGSNHSEMVNICIVELFNSICCFKGLPRRLRLFVLYFSIIFGILLLIILVTCRSEFDLYLLSFWSTGSTFSSSRIPSFLLLVKTCVYLFFRKISSVRHWSILRARFINFKPSNPTSSKVILQLIPRLRSYLTRRVLYVWQQSV